MFFQAFSMDFNLDKVSHEYFIGLDELPMLVSILPINPKQLVTMTLSSRFYIPIGSEIFSVRAIFVNFFRPIQHMRIKMHPIILVPGPQKYQGPDSI